MNQPILSSALVLLITASSLINAAPRIDYDIDNDGLIEIQDLQDLNEIRNNVTQMNYSGEADGFISLELHGDALYGSNDGCPEDGCAGYELINDLNFDTNLNEQFDAGDAYWNEGKGWQSIGSFFVKFVGEFHGNGFTLHNLNINRPGERFVGLFAYSELAHFHDFSLTGHIKAWSDTGAILGYAWKSQFDHLFTDVVIEGINNEIDCLHNCEANRLGGLVGSSDDSVYQQLVIKTNVSGYNFLGGLVGVSHADKINEAAIQASIHGYNVLGGLVGQIDNAEIESVFSVVNINGHSSVGGLIGSSELTTMKNILLSGSVTPGLGTTKYARGGSLVGVIDKDEISKVISLVKLPIDIEQRHFIGALVGSAYDPRISDTYWASDLTLREDMFSRNYNLGISQHFELTDLQCASQFTNCNGLIFDQFSEPLNLNQQPLWRFGNNTQAPIISLTIGDFADRNGDGETDSWPVIEGPTRINNPEPVPEVPATSDSTNSGSGSIWFLLFMIPLFIRRS